MRKNKDLFVLGGIVGDIGTSSLHKAIIEQDNTNLMQITNNTAKVLILKYHIMKSRGVTVGIRCNDIYWFQTRFY